jgi:hypothetical protein
MGECSPHEVFRDTAHGFLAWAFGTLLTASALSSATSYLANGTVAGLGAVAHSDRGQITLNPRSPAILAIADS